MKNLLYLFIALLPSICFAQDSSRLLKSPVLNQCVAQANLVIEGRVISATSFMISRGQIYTSAVVKITKLFKGSFSDSLVELVYYGGKYDTFAVFPSGTGLVLSAGMEGIFAVQNNKTDIKLAQGLPSYFQPIGYIEYIDKKYRGPENHTAFWKGLTYDNLETELFEPIETITKTPRKVFGPNMFEQRSKDSKK